MALYYIQAGTALQKMDTDGTVTTLTLPSGVTINSGTTGRFAVLGRLVAFVNAPSVNLLIDPFDDTVYPMSLHAPVTPMTIAEGGSGNLSAGDYNTLYTFGILNSNGVLISESPFSPPSATVTLAASKVLTETGVSVSDAASVNIRRTYRTTAGGNVYFRSESLDGNVNTAQTDNLSDASLSLLPAPSGLGNPPGTTPGGASMELITVWKGRAFGRAGGVGADKDVLLWSELRKLYAWPATNTLPIPPVGLDEAGITAFIPRRDVFGIAKRDSLDIITNPNPLSGQRRTLDNGVGCVSQESVTVIRDTAFFLGEDGVYAWDEVGVRSISRSKVHPWFTADSVFNRSEFKNSRGWWDPVFNTYNLLLASSGGTNRDKWISFHIDSLTSGDYVWTGPHRTADFTPTLGARLEDTNDLDMPILASSAGFLYKQQATRTDGTATAIDMVIEGVFHSGDSPDLEKLWLRPTIISRIESGGTLTITPTVGGLDASAGSGLSHDLTTGRETLARLGNGRFAQIKASNNTNAEDVTIYGIELPYHILGRR